MMELERDITAPKNAETAVPEYIYGIEPVAVRDDARQLYAALQSVPWEGHSLAERANALSLVVEGALYPPHVRAARKQQGTETELAVALSKGSLTNPDIAYLPEHVLRTYGLWDQSAVTLLTLQHITQRCMIDRQRVLQQTQDALVISGALSRGTLPNEVAAVNLIHYLADTMGEAVGKRPIDIYRMRSEIGLNVFPDTVALSAVEWADFFASAAGKQNVRFATRYWFDREARKGTPIRREIAESAAYVVNSFSNMFSPEEEHDYQTAYCANNHDYTTKQLRAFQVVCLTRSQEADDRSSQVDQNFTDVRTYAALRSSPVVEQAYRVRRPADTTNEYYGIDPGKVGTDEYITLMELPQMMDVAFRKKSHSLQRLVIELHYGLTARGVYSVPEIDGYLQQAYPRQWQSGMHAQQLLNEAYDNLRTTITRWTR